MFLSKWISEIYYFIKIFIKILLQNISTLKVFLKKYKKTCYFFVYLIITYIVCPFFTRWVDYICLQLLIDIVSLCFNSYLIVQNNYFFGVLFSFRAQLQSTFNLINLFLYSNFLFIQFIDFVNSHIVNIFLYILYLITAYILFFINWINFIFPINFIRMFFISNSSSILLFLSFLFFFYFLLKFQKIFFFKKKTY